MCRITIACSVPLMRGVRRHRMQVHGTCIRPRADIREGRTMVSRSWLLTASCIFFTACFHQPTTAQAKQDLPTSIPNLSGYDDETRQTMELACVTERTKGPVAYGACLNRQIASLQNSPGIPNLSRYDDETRQTMELACATERTKGPVAYGACLRKHMESLRTLPRSQ